MPSRPKVSSGNHPRTTKFCSICNHRVYNLETHHQTEEHQRNLLRSGIPKWPLSQPSEKATLVYSSEGENQMPTESKEEVIQYAITQLKLQELKTPLNPYSILEAVWQNGYDHAHQEELSQKEEQ